MDKIKRVLITGITGFVGSHLTDFILEKTQVETIVGLVRWRSPVDNIKQHLDNGRLVLEWGDLEDLSSLENIMLEYQPDVIFHLAAQSYVDFSFQAPIATLLPNVIGTCNLLEGVKNLRKVGEYYADWNPVIHICSSSEVYGQVKKEDIPITEDCPFRPASPYAVSKVAEDMLAYQYHLSWGLKTIRTRMFTHTGPRRGDVFVVSTFAKQIAAIEAGVQKPRIHVGNLDSVRTFMDVRDAVRAYWLLINRCPPGEVYNIGGTETMKIGEMLDRLIEFSSEKAIINTVVDVNRMRPSDVTLQVPSTDKFYKATGWKPIIPFDKTLYDTLEYWREYYGT